MPYGDGTELSKFEAAMEAAGIAWWWMELPSGALFFSPNKANMLGRDPKDFKHYKDFTDLVHTNDYEPIMQTMRDHLDGKTAYYQTSYRIRAKDGSYRTFFDRGKVVERKNGSVTIAGFVFDMTNFNV